MTDLIISQVVNGLVLGFLYVLIAIGLSIIFGMLGVVNFAHGVYFALGAYFALSLLDSLGPWAIMLAPLGVAIIGMVIETTLMRPLYGKEPLLGLFMTFGIALFIEELIRTIWGAAGRPFNPPAFLSGFIVWGPVLVTKYRLFVLLVTILILVALWLFLHSTRYGRIIRAGSRDPEMVSMLGINLKRVFTAVFGLGTAVAGIAGVLAAPLWSVVPSMSEAAIMPAFVVVTIGGLGSFGGAMISGLLVGISVALSIQFWPAASAAVMYALMIVVLLIRPRGLLGESWERFE
ncbi:MULTISPECIES: branched-chain amino acid ABC transporter permease [unclassified Bradyrhizobium]|uniref:branched-chain amino acid ABC transporter permease n=1 Tax=unclassified Bradyrhizobium TaxID=2631580 RepID=UPI002478C03A|nr:MULTISPECIES: branched-chain amino acid ABC transporter permease [unclassified Bradyrhizobium]WGS22981.1 branched-chain amino acid ABC transporter permease [Bradyrhizobium sp. ISRA463]WGS29983.1 branched-chain amino acid ABC transporter permease [Bradyrhizobium sp. ISRA464]